MSSCMQETVRQVASGRPGETVLVSSVRELRKPLPIVTADVCQYGAGECPGMNICKTSGCANKK